MALVWFHTRVRLFVPLQFRQVEEALRAELALEGSELNMDSQVPPQLIPRLVCFTEAKEKKDSDKSLSLKKTTKDFFNLGRQ